MIFAQTPNPVDVMEAARATEQWTVVVVCFLIVSLVGGVVMLFKLLRDSYAKQVADLIETAKAEKIESGEREKNLVARIESLEKEQFTVIMDMFGKMIELIAKTEVTLKEFGTASKEINGDLKQLIVRLDSSPCLIHRMSDVKLVDKNTGEDITG